MKIHCPSISQFEQFVELNDNLDVDCVGAALMKTVLAMQAEPEWR